MPRTPLGLMPCTGKSQDQSKLHTSLDSMSSKCKQDWTAKALHLGSTGAACVALIDKAFRYVSTGDSRHKSGTSWPYRASSAGKAEAVKYLVEEAHAPLEARDNAGETPLFVAAASGEKATALYLISKGADVEVSLALGILHMYMLLTAFNHPDLALLFGIAHLIALQVQAENKDGENPLSEAARHQGLRDAMVAVANGEMEIDG